MNQRISELTKLTLQGKLYAKTTKMEYCREDLFLSRQHKESKRICEYILNQEPVITEFSKMTGFFNFDGSVVGDAFRRGGHKFTGELISNFYLKSVDNLSTMEWQHATADYKKVLEKGIKGIIDEIDISLKVHTDTEEIEFLDALKRVANAMILWSNKCSRRVLEFSANVSNAEYKKNLQILSQALLKVPENEPTSFYEAVLAIYIYFSADPDSVGTLDRYLRPFYEEDIKKGVITRETAKEYLQELFLMLQAVTPVTSNCFTRGGESHFCIGGYLPDGTDGYCDLSKLILESLIELPTYIPQVSLRWTKKHLKKYLNLLLIVKEKTHIKELLFKMMKNDLNVIQKFAVFPLKKQLSIQRSAAGACIFRSYYR